jgi:hypothetical protein
MEENAYKILVGNSEGNGSLKMLVVTEITILKIIFTQCGLKLYQIHIPQVRD